AQKDKPKSTSGLTWETVAADKSSKMTTKRALVPGGWLVLVQSGDDMCLTFLPDVGHAWDDKSPSDANPPKPKFDDVTKSAIDKLKAEVEQARAAAQAERASAEAALKKADEERKKALDQLEKAKQDKKSKKGDTGAAAADLEATKREARAQRDQAE